MKKMKRYLIAVLLVIFSCMIFVPSVKAEDSDSGFADEYNRLLDMGELLSDSEEKELLASLDEISEAQKMDIVIATIESLKGSDIEAYADDLYDYCNFGYGSGKDGILLLVSKNDRQWHISTRGYGITAFTDAGIQYIGKQMKSDLSSGSYADAFHTYIDQCDSFITQARTGKPFDRSSLPKGPMPFLWLLISMGAGLGIAVAVMFQMKGQLKTVRYQAAAGNYVRDGSLNITRSSDVFLYSTVNRTPREKNNASGSSTHTSSSGAAHGGGGGSF